MSGAPYAGRGNGKRATLPLFAAVLLVSAWAVAIAAVTLGPARADAPFVDGFVELPLLEGIEQVPESTVAFDTTGGRIVISFARTTLTPAAVLAAYANPLGQLGWMAVGEGRFEREGEVLAFDFIADGPDTVVRFSLVPE